MSISIYKLLSVLSLSKNSFDEQIKNPRQVTYLYREHKENRKNEKKKKNKITSKGYNIFIEKSFKDTKTSLSTIVCEDYRCRILQIKI